MDVLLQSYRTEKAVLLKKEKEKEKEVLRN